MGWRRHRLRDVSLFFGWAETVVWFCGPVPYEASGLSADLVTDLRAWGEAQRRGDTTVGTDSPIDLREHARRLAHRVAAEIGPEFRVKIDGPKPWLRRISSHHRSINPAAERAFRGFRQREIEWQNKVHDALTNGARLSWQAADPADDPR